MQKIIIVVFLVIVYINTIMAQDVGFTQFYANMLYLNPALAGTTKCPKFGVSYRNNMPVLTNAFTTYSASYDQYFKGIHGGIGILLMRDQQGEGTVSATSAAAMYSFSFKATRNMYIKAGFQVGFTNRQISVGDMIFPDMIDQTTGNLIAGNETLSDKSANHIEFAAGVAAYSNKYFFGIAAHHLNEWTDSENNESYFILARKYTAHAGFNIPVGSGDAENANFVLSPNIIGQKQGEYEQINYGFYARWKVLVAGAWFKQNFGTDINTFAFLLGVTYQGFNIGYSLDFPLTELKNEHFLAHEISLTFVLPCDSKKKEWEAISCPKF